MQYFDTPVLDTQRQPLEPHKIISGGLPGATQIRIGGNENILIDGLHQRITVTTTGGNISMGSTTDGRLAMEVTNTDGTRTGIGSIPGSTQLGFYTLDTAGNVIQKIVGPTRYVYDISTGKNIMQDGKLPDSTYGQATAKAGYNVSEGVS